MYIILHSNYQEICYGSGFIVHRFHFDNVKSVELIEIMKKKYICLCICRRLLHYGIEVCMCARLRAKIESMTPLCLLCYDHYISNQGIDNNFIFAIWKRQIKFVWLPFQISAHNCSESHIHENIHKTFEWKLASATSFVKCGPNTGRDLNDLNCIDFCSICRYVAENLHSVCSVSATEYYQRISELVALFS